MRTSLTFQRLFGVSLVAIGLGAALPSVAQEWPTKPISLIVPFPTGGTTDVLARALGDELSKNLGQPVIVESRPGAGATIGADYVAKAKPDGYTLLMGAVHHTIATSVYKKLPYSFQKDFAPIATVAMVPNVLVVNVAKAPVANVAELVSLAKKSSTELAYGSNGNGTAQHLIGTQFQSATGVRLLHVPYKGSGPLTTDLLGGQVTMSFDTLTPVLPHIQSGKLRALAVATAKRSSVLPDVPTLQEAGLGEFDIGTWFGVLAPAATPKAVVSKLSTEMMKIIKSPDFQQRLRQVGAEPLVSTPDEFAQRINDETVKFAKLVKAGNVAIE
ncbi:tripartite tricarboxylate transporter substrate binding protein [Candidimonas sp. SYP-B2681]|uniref:Bug family tripartite tricarboxylate transporter substrate binding protein n=1 Tax=Candidimonas sp. SYP-B2681 TaxID=2497686 RepID=UPI000F86C331|nr:tripartite tricarboxylate transporter substrate binding protein [Candidimonas sp. SYP-B2681]RTZ43287.1 tripartite tricarboxylate transporter substrate binding protein [Candidimonas sp. SYP-B2681]